jgi:Carboxypeptidase regulatory-like domain
MRSLARHIARRLALALPLWLVFVRPAAAQVRATLSGRITDRSTGRALRNASVILRADKRSATSDSLGQYRFTDMPVGLSYMIVRAVDFPAQQFFVELSPGQHLDRPIVMDSTDAGRAAAAQTLPAVGVTAAAPVADYRLVAFEHRRHTGRGQYLTEDQIVSSGAYDVADALKAMRGVNYECNGGGCFVRMARAPLRCLPEYVVDDHVMNDFGPLTPIRDIVGLELYTGPSEVPGEYAGRNAGCGVVVIWTRSGPKPKPR